ncbi:MAG: hypothetical protein ACI4XM_02940 [Candidatus Coprovivens sp.]
MNEEKLENSLLIFQNVKEILKNFSTKEETIEYLIKETKISREECTRAYDFIMKMEIKKGRK